MPHHRLVIRFARANIDVAAINGGAQLNAPSIKTTDACVHKQSIKRTRARAQEQTNYEQNALWLMLWCIEK